MSDSLGPQIVKGAGTFFIDSTTTNPENTPYTIQNLIPIQDLKLVSYRIQFDSAENAVTQGQIWVDLPFFSVDHLVDNNGNNNGRLPLTLSNNVVTHEKCSDFTINMSVPAQKNGYMRIYGDDGNLLTSNLVRVGLTFEYKFTSNV